MKLALVVLKINIATFFSFTQTQTRMCTFRERERNVLKSSWTHFFTYKHICHILNYIRWLNFLPWLTKYEDFWMGHFITEWLSRSLQQTSWRAIKRMVFLPIYWWMREKTVFNGQTSSYAQKPSAWNAIGLSAYLMLHNGVMITHLIFEMRMRIPFLITCKKCPLFVHFQFIEWIQKVYASLGVDSSARAHNKLQWSKTVTYFEDFSMRILSFDCRWRYQKFHFNTMACAQRIPIEMVLFNYTCRMRTLSKWQLT